MSCSHDLPYSLMTSYDLTCPHITFKDPLGLSWPVMICHALSPKVNHMYPKDANLDCSWTCFFIQKVVVASVLKITLSNETALIKSMLFSNKAPNISTDKQIFIMSLKFRLMGFLDLRIIALNLEDISAYIYGNFKRSFGAIF